MAWETDADLTVLVHDKDVTEDGAAHYFALHLVTLDEQDPAQELKLHEAFLNIFWQEFHQPDEALEKASPAIIYQALSSMLRTNQIQYKLIDLLKNKHKSNVSDFKTVDEAVKNYTDFEDKSWVHFEYLSMLLKRAPNKTDQDEKFANFIMQVYSALAPTDEQILERRASKQKQNEEVDHGNAVNTLPSVEVGLTEIESKIDEKKNGDDTPDSKETHSVQEVVIEEKEQITDKRHKKKNKNNKIKVKPASEQEPKNDLITAILDLNPMAVSVDGAHWRVFFMALCESVKKFMPYKNLRIESYDLLMHELNDAAFKKLIKDAIDFARKNNVVNEVLILLIIAKFNDDLIKCKNAPITISMPEIVKTFQNPSNFIWDQRVQTEGRRIHFFNDIFPPEYLKTLDLKQRYEVRVTFEKTTERFCNYPSRTKLIKYCANKLGPKDDPSPNTSSGLVMAAPVQQSAHVEPGTENKPWGKFIEKVYSQFEKSNDLWDPNINDDEKLKRLQPMLTQFKIDFSTEPERAQAYRFFISFSSSGDCKFAENARDYAWLFMENMVLQSTAAPALHLQTVRDIKNKLEQDSETFKQAEELIFSFQK